MTPEQLQKARARLGLTQDQIARALKTTVRTISRWETGARAIPPYLEITLTALKPRRVSEPRAVASGSRKKR